MITIVTLLLLVALVALFLPAWLILLPMVLR